MRPNLAFGPIDSIAQYLLYVSVVVLGVVLPLLVQMWRQKRHDAKLVAETLSSLTREIQSNRERLSKSRDSFKALWEALSEEYDQYVKLWGRLGEDGVARQSIEPPSSTGVSVSFAALTSTAWEVAHLSGGSRLMSGSVLAKLTRVYHLQKVFEDSRLLYLEISFRANALEAPMSLSNRSIVEGRLQSLAVSRAAARYQADLAETVLVAHDEFLKATPAT
jgi:hypothetical protein